MIVVTFLLVFLGFAALFSLLFYWAGAAIKRQANKPIKRFFAPVPRPGSFSFVTNEGRVEDVFENVVGWSLETIKDRRLFTLGKNNNAGFLEKNLGVKWIGPYPTIKSFSDWEWSELQEREVEEDGKKVIKYEITTRKANVSDFFFQFSHPIRTEAIEILGNTQVALTMLITVLNLDPERAQFLNKDPAILLAGMIQSTIKSYICDMSFDEIKRMTGTATRGQQQDQDQKLWDKLKALNGLEMGEKGNPMYETEDPLGVFGKLGKFIVRGEIIQVEAVGAAAAAIEAEKIAELKGNADIKAAEKTGDALIMSAKKRKEAAVLDAAAQRTLNEQNAGYFASLPGGDRMFVAAQLAGKDSDVTTWVEGGNDTKVTIPLPMAPPKPKEPEGVPPATTTEPQNKKPKKA
ncbi:MAG: hypothetical protein WC657_03350 [Candidatus Paceibacterota bacterium]|jgi:hypothetical protein